MKRIIAGLFVALVFLTPSVTRAQTVDQNTLDALRIELIALLQEQVNLLIAQLQALEARQAVLEDNQASMTDAPVVGGSEEQVVDDTEVSIVRVEGEEVFLDIAITGSYNTAYMHMWAPNGDLIVGHGYTKPPIAFRIGRLNDVGSYPWEVHSVTNGVKATQTGVFEVE